MRLFYKYFPDALRFQKLEEKIDTILEENNLFKNKTLWATSICSDEINHSFDRLGSKFAGSGPFLFGGISGLPFAGQTGFSAFKSHIPDNGSAVIFFGPHIGFTESGEIGKVCREGQSEPSGCCGSILGALNTLVHDNPSDLTDASDYQQSRVKNVLKEHFSTLIEQEKSIIDATNILYRQIKEEIVDIVNRGKLRKDNKILLIGGIIINRDSDKEDYFDLRDIIIK